MDKRTKDTIAQYDKIAKEYDINRKKNEVAIDQVEKFINLFTKKSKVLDIGCASGCDTKFISEHNLDVTGVDLSKKLLKIARVENPNSKFVYGDIRHLPFKDLTFDGIMAKAILHHLTFRGMKKSLQEIYRVLKNNGLIFIMTKAGEGEIKVEDKLSANLKREFTLISEDMLDKLLINNGYKKIYLNTWNEKEYGPNNRDLLWISAIYRKSNALK